MAEAEAGSSPPAAKGGLLGKPIVLIGLVVTLMLVEFVVLYMFLPRPATAADVPAAEEVDTATEAVEVTIDSFNTTNTTAAPGSSIHLTFKVTAVVEAGQNADFDLAVTQNQNARVRDAVLMTARAASLEDINDPSLSTFKRQLRDAINKTLRKSYVSEIVISDFRAIEQ